MCSEKNRNPFQDDELEKWLKSFFLDPFTSILDQTHFRIDLFDSNSELIIEALLPPCQKDEVTIYLNDNQVIIKVIKSPNQCKERTIMFPFKINTQKVTASFVNNILEVTISKTKQEGYQNRSISL
ncbi:MAG TPA: Hsp20 family protein [Pseudoneobacillus sp.]|nr:Hsp20 family protein [Pseudoneobacillus sp.]